MNLLCCIPGIYSNTDLYSSSVIDGKTGVLANNTVSEWEEKISMMIENPEIRDAISHNAHLDIEQNYKFESFIQTWKDDLLSLDYTNIANCEDKQKQKQKHVLYFCDKFKEKSLSNVISYAVNLLDIEATSFDYSDINNGYFLNTDSDKIGIFLIENNNQLTSVVLNSIYFTTVILDFTEYKGSVDEIIKNYRLITNKAIVRVLISAADIKCCKALDKEKISYSVINIGIIDAYRLDGYHGVYFDIIENIFKDRIVHSLIIDLLRIRPLVKIKSLVAKCIMRAKVFWILLKWVTGFRPL